MAERRVISNEDGIEICDIDIVYTALWQAEMLGLSVRDLMDAIEMEEVQKVEDFEEAIAASYSLCALIRGEQE